MEADVTVTVFPGDLAFRQGSLDPGIGEGVCTAIEADFHQGYHGPGIVKVLQCPLGVFFARLPAPGVEVRNDGV